VSDYVCLCVLCHFAHVCVGVYMAMGWYVCRCIYIETHIYMCVYKYTYILFMRVRACVYMFIFIHTYTCM